MKKKIVTLLLVAAMTGTMVVGCGSKADDKTADTKTEQTDDKKDTEEKKELADDEYQYVSAADTVIADGVHVLDVREWENYSKGSCLLYTSDAADEEDSLDLGGRRIIKQKK